MYVGGVWGGFRFGIDSDWELDACFLIWLREQIISNYYSILSKLSLIGNRSRYDSTVSSALDTANILQELLLSLLEAFSPLCLYKVVIDFVGLLHPEFVPKHMNQGVSEESQTKFVTSLTKDFEENGPNVTYIRLHQKFAFEYQRLTPDDTVGANHE